MKQQGTALKLLAQVFGFPERTSGPVTAVLLEDAFCFFDLSDLFVAHLDLFCM